MNNELENYIVLPHVEIIKRYSVSELTEDINLLLTPESKIFQTAIHICQLISLSKRKFTTDDYIEYKDQTHSNYMLGTTHVTNGAMAIFSVVSAAGLFKIENEDNVTIFEFKRILDVLSGDDNVDGQVGSYVRKFTERALIKNFRKTGQVQVTERLRERFVKCTKEDPLVLEKSHFSVKNKSFCEETYNTLIYQSLKNEEREDKIYRDVVHSVPLRPGNISVISTPVLKQLLIDVACIVDRVDFNLLFLEFSKRIQDWLLNTPLSYDLNLGDENSDDKEEFRLQDVLSDNGPLEDSFRQIVIENEASDMLDLFDSEELFFIKQILENKTIEEILPLVNTKKSATAEKIKKVKQKLGAVLVKRISNLNTMNDIENDYEMHELMVAFTDEMKYLRMSPENV